MGIKKKRRSLAFVEALEFILDLLLPTLSFLFYFISPWISHFCTISYSFFHPFHFTSGVCVCGGVRSECFIYLLDYIHIIYSIFTCQLCCPHSDFSISTASVCLGLRHLLRRTQLRPRCRRSRGRCGRWATRQTPPTPTNPSARTPTSSPMCRRLLRSR